VDDASSLPPGDWRAWCKVPAIRELQKETPAGTCVFCGRSTEMRHRQKTREKYRCVRADCQTAYNTEFVRWVRLERVKAGKTQRGTARKGGRRWVQVNQEKDDE